MSRPMVVVPQDLLESLRYNQEQKMGTVGKQLVTLDSEMKDILNADLPDAEKAQKYFQTVQKYMMTKEMATTLPPSETKETPEIILSPVDDVPLKQRKKAEQVFNWMKRVAPDSITWNKRGEVEGIPGSNIADLVTELTKVKSTSTPTGFAKFTELVKEANIPQALVSNKDHWQNYFSPVRDDDIYETPANTPVRRPPRTPTDLDRTFTLTPTRTPPPVNVPKRTWLTLRE